MDMESTSHCWSYCEHGGVCELLEGHDGLHDSRYCQWDDDHAVSEEEADETLRAKDPFLGATLVGMTHVLRALDEEELA